MKFSMKMMAAFLEEFETECDIQNDAWQIEDIRVTQEEAEGQSSEMYIFPGKDGAVICRNGGSDITVFGSDVFTVANRILEGMHYYNKWEMKAMRMLGKQSTHQESFALISQLFPRFTIKVMTPEGRLLYVDGEQSFEPINPRLIYLMKNTPSCYEVVQGKSNIAVFWSKEYYLKHILFGRLVYADGVFLMFSIMEKEGTRITDVEIHLAEILQKIFSRMSFNKSDETLSTSAGVFVKMLSGEPVSQTETELFESVWGNSVRSGAVLAVISNPALDRFSESAIVYTLTEKLPTAFALQHRDYTFCLLPAKREEQDLPYLMETIRSIELNGCISDCLYAWDQLRPTVELAEYVLEKTDLPEWPVFCRNYMWEYYLHCFRGAENKIPIQADLLRLKAMKEESDNALMDTLYCYLKNNGHMSQTAEELHIHLSTLKYRMARIEQLIHFDLHDYDSRMVFLLSYEMLQEKEKEREALR